MGESPAVELRRAPSGAKRSSFAPEEHETRGVAIFYSPSRLRLWNAFLTLKSGTLLIQIKNVVLIYAVLSLGVFMVFYSSAKGCGFLVYERAAMDARAEVDGDVADYDSDGDEARCLRWIAASSDGSAFSRNSRPRRKKSRPCRQFSPETKKPRPCRPS